MEELVLFELGYTFFELESWSRGNTRLILISVSSIGICSSIHSISKIITISNDKISIITFYSINTLSSSI